MPDVNHTAYCNSTIRRRRTQLVLSRTPTTRSLTNSFSCKCSIVTWRQSYTVVDRRVLYPFKYSMLVSCWCMAVELSWVRFELFVVCSDNFIQICIWSHADWSHYWITVVVVIANVFTCSESDSNSIMKINFELRDLRLPPNGELHNLY